MTDASNATSIPPPASFRVDRLPVRILSDRTALGRAAAADAAMILIQAICERGGCRILVATGNSQVEFISSLVRQPGVDWAKVEAFHLDEYVGISAEHPASFRKWIRTRFAEKIALKGIHYLQGDAPDADVVASQYAAALRVAPIDLAFVGFGENGHIAFNDPAFADFDDPMAVKRVALDEACRRQQVGEGHFADLPSVPREALTVTCSALMQARHWICCVPELRKAKAVKGALEGPISPACPASIARRHSGARLYLDRESAALLSAPAAPPNVESAASSRRRS